MTSRLRDELQEIAARWDLAASTADQFERLLTALAAEPDPHTTVSDPRRAVDVHIRDSLCALQVRPLREAQVVADIGSGAGFPGLPLAIAIPDARFDLVESASRKTAVIDRLAAAAGITNARSIHARVEEWARGDQPARSDQPSRSDELSRGDQPAWDERVAAYDVATARAVAPLAVLVEYAAPLLRIGGTFIAWKGSPEAAEVAGGAAAAAELGLEPLDALPVTPFEGSRGHHLYLYSKVEETSHRFPRRPGMASKRPLGA